MSVSQLEVRVYRSLDELETIRAPWDELLASYALATTFSTPEWLMPWWRSFGGEQELLVLGLLDGARLVGLAPFSLTRVRAAKAIPLRVLRLMGDGSQDSDNLDLPVVPGFEDRVAEALLKFLTEERNWDFAALDTMPAESLAAGALRKLLAHKKWTAIEKSRPASAITLPPTWEEYLRLLSSKERGKVGLRTRRLEKKYEVRIRKCEQNAEIAPFLQALYDLHGKHWQLRGAAGTLHVTERRQFYEGLARGLLQRGRLELWVLELQGKIVAAQFGFRHGNAAFSLQEGFDPDYAADSVGYVLRSQVLKHLIEDGIRRYDFLGGIDESKKRWGAEAGNYTDLSFARPFSAGAAYLRSQHYAGQSKLWLRQNLPASAWEMLHRINLGVRGTVKREATSAAGKNAAEDSTQKPED
jgi:CelD/BcsL family acetyltransferase involved in cellulose biosynthesis